MKLRPIDAALYTGARKLVVEPVRSVGHGAQALHGNVGEGARTLKEHLEQLRQAAIEPLPLPNPLPVSLRELEWRRRKEWQDEADAVRDLSGLDHGPSDHNDLGCAYALLAFKHGSDEYWLRAIQHLHHATSGKVAPRARANLRRVSEVSGIPATG
jgi:hypothetical protein